MSLFEKKISPMLAFTSKPFDSPAWLFELKFDGIRAIAYIDQRKREVRLLGRRMRYIEHKFPELELWKDVKADKLVLDGEICVFKHGKPDFYALLTRNQVEDETRISLLSKLEPAVYIAFDVLYVDGKAIINEPLIQRKKLLESLVKESERLLISKWVKGDGKAYYEQAIKLGFEGIIAKKLDSTYEFKRSHYWLKIKEFKTFDCIICGYLTGKGLREKLFGSLILGAYSKGKLRHVGNVGTGFEELEMSRLMELFKRLEAREELFKLEVPEGREAVWLKPELVCEIKFFEISKDLKFRNPVYLRLRPDKRPEECSLDELG